MPSEKLLLQIPADLVCDRRVPALAKALYMTLIKTGPCSVKELSSASGVNRETVRQLARMLAGLGWVTLAGRSNRKVIMAARPQSTQEALAARLRVVRQMLNPVGENLSRLLLDVLVDDDNYIDNARPSFLQNPTTSEYLELDRWYYRRRVGEEYEGIQHFIATTISDEKNLREIQARDTIKAEICRAKGIPLMILTEEDLSLDGVLAKLPPQLPRAHFDRKDLYIQTLEELCEEYVASCRRARARERAKSLRESREQ